MTFATAGTKLGLEDLFPAIMFSSSNGGKKPIQQVSPEVANFDTKES
jgi:hypothetical protein